MFSDWHSNVAFHTGGVQATCAINSSPYFQNLLSSTLALRVSFKTKQPPQSCLLCIQPKSQKSTLTLSLHHCRPCLQWCAPNTNGPSCRRGRTGVNKVDNFDYGVVQQNTWNTMGIRWWSYDDQETRITGLLQMNSPLSNIAGYVSDVHRRFWCMFLTFIAGSQSWESEKYSWCKKAAFASSTFHNHKFSNEFINSPTKP